ncbi:MAG: hypothetical protein HYY68_04770 [Thaumarchaeota archaeon]|nr:hypothetical protein [Nitrososphaerota archaeon]
MEARISEAFAPAAISNFFAIHDDGLGSPGFFDFSHVGATGGGFTLSKGVFTRVAVFDGSNERRIRIKVNGDQNYRATTTRRAIELLVDSAGLTFSSAEIEQWVEVPIGYGFGTSAASALSAVLAISSALGLSLSKKRVAYYAHAADIICQTGLGTVSSIWNHSGAGVIVTAGAPGVAKVVNIPVPKRLRLVVGLLAPFRKSKVLSSRPLRNRINKYGEAAVSSVVRNPKLDNLAREGEHFAEKLNLSTPEIRRLMRLSLENGAVSASQNMIGQAVHALVSEDKVEGLADVIRSDPSSPEVIVTDIGNRPATILESGLHPYPATIGSLR